MANKKQLLALASKYNVVTLEGASNAEITAALLDARVDLKELDERSSNVVTTVTVAPDPLPVTSPVAPIAPLAPVSPPVPAPAPVVEPVRPAIQVEPIPETVDDSNDEVLVIMERQNWSFHVLGYKFSREHPFAVVRKSDVDHLVRVEGGFRLATESEAREYYS